VRYGFRGRGVTNLLIFLPMSTPEIVLGASLLTLFLSSQFPLGFWSILIAHIMFNISYVVVTVKARLVGFDRHLEEAAMDLGANELTTFWRVTLPLIAPGILAALLLAFALSVDDFVITNFNAGTTVTFPLFVWGEAVPAMAGAEEVVAGIEPLDGVEYSGLVLNERGWERLRATRLQRVNCTFAATESFNLRNGNASLAEAVARVEEVVRAADRPV